MRILLKLFAAIFFALPLTFLVTGCGGSSIPTSVRPLATSQMAALLSGVQMVPRVNTQAGGSALVEIDAADGELALLLNLRNLRDVTAVEVRLGRPGTNGPVLWRRALAASGTFPTPWRQVFGANDLQRQPAAGINTMSDALATVRRGAAYLQVVTAGRPGGELRGQIQGRVVALTATLRASSVVPPVTDGTRGTATLTLEVYRALIGLEIATPGITPTATPIFLSTGGATGVPLFNAGAGPGPFTLTPSSLRTQPAQGINSMADALSALMLGEAYLQLASSAQPRGHLRGPIAAAE